MSYDNILPGECVLYVKAKDTLARQYVIITHCLFNLDADLALVLARPLVLISLTELLQREDLGVNDRSKLIRVGLNSTAHILHLGTASNKETSGSAEVGKAVEETRVALISAANEANNRDDTVDLDSVEGLLHGCRTSNLDDVVDTSTAGEFLGLGSPLRSLAVVDDVVSTKLLKKLSLLSRAGSSDDLCTSSLGELNSKDTNTTGTLSENPLAGEELLALKTVQTVPGSETSAGESSSLVEVEVRGHGDKAVLIEGTDGAEGSVSYTTETGLDAELVERSANVALVEESDDLVAGTEAGDVLADGEDSAGAIGAGDDAVLGGERVLSEREDEIAVVEGSTLDLDEDLAVTELGNRLLAELQTAEVLSITGRDGPLLDSLGNRLSHCEV